MELLSA
jgi:hypothetical protein